MFNKIYKISQYIFNIYYYKTAYVLNIWFMIITFYVAKKLKKKMQIKYY
jgi:hypothetical protein